MIDKGGPAFPRTGSTHDNPISGAAPQDGMTLRDYFAAKAMQAIATMDHVNTYASAADRAYAMADAMLKAREA